MPICLANYYDVLELSTSHPRVPSPTSHLSHVRVFLLQPETRDRPYRKGKRDPEPKMGNV
ncbi:hypothetical protein GJ744_008359 [Endocarpon pusillum]|uniref:Uncharacterized protein n=1 Tax=Endocarpon pusillum TaxID=364733 RepID=A0A8H7AJK3_9EURO|nr:hypothetical protein GJ744_008359 [Endocarpon pusillum]